MLLKRQHSNQCLGNHKMYKVYIDVLIKIIFTRILNKILIIELSLKDLLHPLFQMIISI